MFQQEGNWSSQAGKTFRTVLLCWKNFPLNGQTRQVKSYSQPVNLPGAQLKPLGLTAQHRIGLLMLQYTVITVTSE